MMVNIFNDSYTSVANSMGIDTGSLGYSMAKAQETARLNASMQAIMAKKYLPVAKGYLTVIFVGIIPILMLIALATNSFIKPFAMIFGILIALSLWGVGEQLLDFIIYVKLKSMMDSSGLFQDAGNRFSLPALTFTDAAITETLTLSLGMYWMIPTLAFSIATLSGYAASSMMSGISGIANAGVSSAASEAAGGNISMGNIRMNNVNMNKYDATQAWSAGSANKLSMDNQQTASHQSIIKVGDENSTRNVDESVHKGATWITDSQTGKVYEVNGTFESTSGGWSGKGTINEYDKNGKFIGSYNGELTGTGNMADYQEYVRKGGHGGSEDAFLAQSVVSRNLDASDKVTDNFIRENKMSIDNSQVINNDKTDSEVTSITRGTEIKDLGKSYSYNSSAIAQDIQSGHDANGSLDMIRQKYDNMKEMESTNNPMAAAARADYEKAITAYSLAAAQGLPISASVGESDQYNRSNQTLNYEQAQIQTGGSIGLGASASGASLGINSSATYSEGSRINSSHSSSEGSQSGVYLDTTALKIRGTIENGFNNGNSNNNILSSLGDRGTYR